MMTLPMYSLEIGVQFRVQDFGSVTDDAGSTKGFSCYEQHCAEIAARARGKLGGLETVSRSSQTL